MYQRTDRQVELFLQKVSKGTEVTSASVDTPCWTWTGSIDVKGYGGFSVTEELTGEVKIARAHRVSYEYLKGGTLVPGSSILHPCDNPSCVNPDHLLQATNQENVADKMRKGRGNGWKGKNVGELNGQAKLSNSQLEQVYLRIIAGVHRFEIAKEFGIDPGYVREIQQGKKQGNVESLKDLAAQAKAAPSCADRRLSLEEKLEIANSDLPVPELMKKYGVGRAAIYYTRSTAAKALANGEAPFQTRKKGNPKPREVGLSEAEKGKVLAYAAEKGLTAVVGFPDYFANEEGEVFSLRKGVASVRKLKPVNDRAGYPYLNLYGEGSTKGHARSVHSLVMETFVGPRPAGMLIDHVNRNRQDTRLVNLRYVSAADNRANWSEDNRKKHAERASKVMQKNYSDPKFVEAQKERASSLSPEHLEKLRLSSERFDESRVLAALRRYFTTDVAGPALAEQLGMSLGQFYRLATGKSRPHLLTKLQSEGLNTRKNT